jgi:diguanylate cyclase (GGDEF)-like protein/PAS domain S-box-containing protein
LQDADDIAPTGRGALTAAIEDLGEALLVADPQARIGYLNAAASRLTGWSPRQAIGQPLNEVVRLAGAQDPAQPAAEPGVPEGVRYTLLLHRSGLEVPVRCSVSRTRDGGRIVLLQDSSEEHRLRQHLAYQADHDPLTGLVNRREFESRLARALLVARRGPCQHALCYLDLDRFKPINDTCGHAAGDELLRQVTTLLLTQIRGRDTLARLGGDEFAVLLEHCPLDEARRIAEKLRAAVDAFRFAWKDSRFAIGVSIGLVPVERHATEPAALLALADAACYAAKAAGRNRVAVSPAGDDPSLDWAGALREALAGGSLELWQQPIRRGGAGGERPLGHELYLRLRLGEGLAEPPQFLEAAHHHRLMKAIDRHVIERAVRWLRQGAPEAGRLFLNVSADSLTDRDFGDYVLGVLQRFGVPGERLCLEIPETTAGRLAAEMVRLRQAVRPHGCALALDRFGEQRGALGDLRELGVDFVKLAGSLVRASAGDPVSMAVLSGTVQVCRSLGVDAVATGVESRAALGRLAEIGVQWFQGYGLDPPAPLPA